MQRARSDPALIEQEMSVQLDAMFKYVRGLKK
jgi:hypothetical protein